MSEDPATSNAAAQADLTSAAAAQAEPLHAASSETPTIAKIKQVGRFAVSTPPPLPSTDNSAAPSEDEDGPGPIFVPTTLAGASSASAQPLQPAAVAGKKGGTVFTVTSESASSPKTEVVKVGRFTKTPQTAAPADPATAPGYVSSPPLLLLNSLGGACAAHRNGAAIRVQSISLLSIPLINPTQEAFFAHTLLFLFLKKKIYEQGVQGLVHKSAWFGEVGVL